MSAVTEIRPFRRTWDSPADESGQHRASAAGGGGKFQPQDWPAVTGPSDPAMIAMLAEGRLISPLAARYGFTATQLREAGLAAGLFYDGASKRMSPAEPVPAARPPAIRPLKGGTGWQSRAACDGTDPELFFAEDENSIAEAKAVCARCPVRADCLDWALANRPDGIWGGLAEGEHRKLRRKAAA